ncbi:hypothetical protein GUJ93_ZPchr0005g14882 [Zizania palustris]|uniref:Uncharacterized protein n=1 Tax=Zizania palustris TaxID=103762 RepID=A0A8J5TA12_ZIZPA|nr:hypothetical protein GUJ93_ZPchr0005g14882 [Zizania palustris]
MIFYDRISQVGCVFHYINIWHFISLGFVCHGTKHVADDLVLEGTSCSLGVLLIVFESRPNASVQIASLVIRGGNCLLIKG